MPLNTSVYGTVEEAAEYFANRLHETAWTNASASDKAKSLIAARGFIDALAFKGYKHTVYVVLLANSEATDEEIRIAEAAQALEFPRGADTVVPEDIRVAQYEIAYALLDGKDPELELENLAVEAMTYGPVKTVYARAQLPIEHIVNLIPSSVAWRLLRPYLRDAETIKLSRVS